jgi:hypothetical protein
LLLGELVSANEHLEQALAAFDLRQPLSSALEAWRLSALFFRLYGLARLGYPDRARVRLRQMLEVAQRSSAPYVLAQASNFAALHHLARGDATSAQKYAEETMALTEEMGLLSLEPWQPPVMAPL